MPGGRAAYRELGNVDDDPQVFIATDRPDPAKDPIAALRAKIGETQARLAIIDPLVTFLPVADTNDYGKVYATLIPLRELARETECAILCVHHHRKGVTDDPGAPRHGLDRRSPRPSIPLSS